jgi:hypothetical protein
MKTATDKDRAEAIARLRTAEEARAAGARDNAKATAHITPIPTDDGITGTTRVAWWDSLRDMQRPGYTPFNFDVRIPWDSRQHIH